MGDSQKVNEARQDRPQNTRPTIGLLIESTAGTGGYQSAVWAGVANAAQERNANLICFAGGALGFSAFNEFEGQRNVIYDLVTADNVDGLVISGSVGSFVDPEEFRDFLDCYRPLPVVSIAVSLAGIPSVLVDNEKGMRDAITHLIEVHGHRRIAFIRGPEDNEEAEQRYRVYTDVLAEYGLHIDPDLITPGDFVGPAGAEAIHLLLDQRKADFEAVVAANDNMALAALKALQARGIRVPYEAVVVGFDDLEEARAVTPSLTTVRQPIYEQGKQAAETLLALLAGEEVPEQVTLPTELMVRQSCGCSSPAVVQAGTGQVERIGQTFEAALAAQQEHILSEIAQAAGGPPLVWPLNVQSNC